jgi:hypothetical protein
VSAGSPTFRTGSCSCSDPRTSSSSLEIYAETLDFLGLPPWELSGYEPRNPTADDLLDPALRAQLEERFAEPNAHLARLLGRDLGWGS